MVVRGPAGPIGITGPIGIAGPIGITGKTGRTGDATKKMGFATAMKIAREWFSYSDKAWIISNMRGAAWELEDMYEGVNHVR